jgi:hypothetical protein
MHKYLFVAIGCLSLSGCIGTAFVFDEHDELSVCYPDLHDVPDKPPCPDLAAYKQAEETLSCGQSEAMTTNKQLREQFKLDTQTTKPPKE